MRPRIDHAGETAAPPPCRSRREIDGSRSGSGSASLPPAPPAASTFADASEGEWGKGGGLTQPATEKMPTATSRARNAEWGALRRIGRDSAERRDPRQSSRARAEACRRQLAAAACADAPPGRDRLRSGRREQGVRGTAACDSTWPMSARTAVSSPSSSNPTAPNSTPSSIRGNRHRQHRGVGHETRGHRHRPQSRHVSHPGLGGAQANAHAGGGPHPRLGAGSGRPGHPREPRPTYAALRRRPPPPANTTSSPL
jgi:hypothetical protein